MLNSVKTKLGAWPVPVTEVFSALSLQHCYPLSTHAHIHGRSRNPNHGPDSGKLTHATTDSETHPGRPKRLTENMLPTR